MRHAALAAAVLLLLATPGRAGAKQAAPSTRAEVTRLAKLSHQQYQQGDYAAAAQTLLQAYQLEPVPALLFNAAKTFEKAGNVEQAMRFYQRYIDAENSDPRLLRQASHALDALRLQQDEKLRKEREIADKAAADRAAADKAAADKAAADRAAVEPAAHEPARSDLTQSVPPSSQQVEHRAARSRVVPYTLVGVGLAGLGGGAVLGLSAQSLANQEKASTDAIDKPDLRSKAKQRALLADVSYGLGGAALVAGVVMIFLEPREEKLAAALPRPVLLDHGAELCWGGAW
jgi:tetratricopeptide (TPR) repeat protein